LRLRFTGCVLCLLVVSSLLQAADGKPVAQALMTDQVKLPLSDKFGTIDGGAFTLTAGGDSYFTIDGLTLFRWNGSSGARTRLLQNGDPHPVVPDSIADVTGTPQGNALGHFASVQSWLSKSDRNDRGIFLYNGSAFEKIAMRGESPAGTTLPQVFFSFGAMRLNDADQVAFGAGFEPRGSGSAGIFVGSVSTVPVKVVEIGDLAPGTGGGAIANFNLIDFNDAGQVVFTANLTGGTTPRGLFIGTTTSLTLVSAAGDPAPGTGANFANLTNNVFLNNNGELVFFAQLDGPPGQGIWKRDGSGTLSKVVIPGDLAPVGPPGMTFLSPISLRGFNDGHQVLFSANVTDPPGPPTGPTHGLFLHDLSTTTTTAVFARGDAAPGAAPGEVLFTTRQASLNQAGDVAFLADLSGGPPSFGPRAGWFFRDGGASPSTVKIAIDGDAAPGGTFGISGEILPAVLTATGEVAFIADVIGPNDIGLFRWSPSSAIVPIVTTADPLPAGASTLVRTPSIGASDDRIAFHAFRAGGQVTFFSKPIKPGAGQIQRLAGEGDPAPSVGGRMWRMLVNVRINDAEQVPLPVGAIIGGAVYPAAGFFLHDPGAGLQKLVASGDPADTSGAGPGTDGVFLNFNSPNMPLSSSGEVAFFASLIGTSPGTFNGVFAASPAGVRAIVRRNDPAPTGGVFIGFSASSLPVHATGLVGFSGQTSMSPGVGLFTGDGLGPLSTVVAPGDPHPSTTATVEFVPNQFLMDNGGRLGYAVVFSDGTEGLFVGPVAAANAVALTGAPAPGIGGTFSTFAEGAIDLNGSGSMAFAAGVTGGSKPTGYYVGTPGGTPVLKLVEGQALPGGGAAGPLAVGGPGLALADSGELAIRVENVTGAANLMRFVIVAPGGTLRAFYNQGEKIDGTGSYSAGGFVPTTNSASRFFSLSLFGQGPVGEAIVWDGKSK
jgi:hypothetical protein